MSAVTDPRDSVKQAIATCLKSGEPFAVSLSDLGALAKTAGKAAFTARVTFDSSENPLADLSIYRLAALMPGVPLAQWLPRNDLLGAITDRNGAVALDRMDFLVGLDAKGNPAKLLGIGVHVAFSSLNSDKIAGLSSVSAALTGLSVEVFLRGAKPSASVNVEGQLKLGAVDLDVDVECPSLVFTSRLLAGQAYPSFAAVFDGFGLSSPAAFKNLLLSEFDLMLSPQDKNALFNAVAIPADGKPQDLIKGVLGFDGAAVALQYDGVAVSGSLSSSFVFFDKVVLVAQITTGGGAWTVDAGLDLPATLAAMYPGLTPAPTMVAIADLVAATGLVLPDQLEKAFAAIGVAGLGGSVTIDTGADSVTYGFHADFQAHWALGSVDMLLDTTISLGNGDVTDQIVAAFDIDGFDLTMTAALPKAKGAATFTVTAAQLGGLTASYDLGSSTLTLTLGNTGSGGTLGQVLADFIAIFTGDPYTALPAPWNLLDDVPLPDFQVGLDFAAKTVVLDYTLKAPVTFLGCGVTGFRLSYASQPVSGQSKYHITVLGDFPPLNTSNPGWDPTKPSSAPSVPGLGGAYVDIPLFAIGQHVDLGAQTSVEAAIEAIQTLNQSIGDPNAPLPPKMFSPDVGWLVGARLVLLGQVDVRVVFSDPDIYGVSIYVSPTPYFDGAPNFAYLKALANLFAEILYRKVSASVGVYEGVLTFPDSIRNINMGSFQLQLPSIAVQIYTNGDFLIDVGFPHNGDFSHSAVISAGEYYGAGGVLYGQLGGVAADGLPAVQTYTPAGSAISLPVGVFNPVTEFGLGFQVGIYKSFSAGPMSAAMGVLVQGIFQGTFAKFTTQPPSGQSPDSEEFYSVYANVAIIGKLEGSVDFVIISASLLVEIILSASVVAISHRQVEVPMSAEVEVEASVSIDCGLFTIHIHFSFSTSISYTATFGKTTPAMWERIPWQPSVNALFLGVGATAGASMAYPPLVCGGAVAFPLYVVPQLTRGTDQGKDSWLYVLQFALISPEATAHLGTNVALTNPAGATAHDLAKLAGAWLIQAWQQYKGGIPASGTSPDDLYSKILVAKDHLQGVTDYVHDALAGRNGAVLPQPAEVQAFYKTNLAFDLLAPQAGNALGLAFFPVLPDVSLSADNAVRTLAVDGQAVADVALDFLLVIGLAAVQGAQKVFAADQAETSLGSLYAAMETTKAGNGTVMGAAVGSTTRFMLHGTRIDGAPLYAKTGQVFTLDDLSKTSLTFTVTATGTAQWGTVAPTTLTVTAPYAPNVAAGFAASVQETGIVPAAMKLAVTADRQFVLGRGQGGATAVIRALPPAMTGLLRNGDGAAPVVLKAPPSGGNGDVTLGNADFRWASVVSFTISKVPGSPDIYALWSVRSDSLDLLKVLFTDRTAQPPRGSAIEALELGYMGSGGADNGSLVLKPVDSASVFMFRNNISTETHPSPALRVLSAAVAAPATDAPGAIDFITTLMLGGLTNSGGYYLYCKGGLPVAFDNDGRAEISLIAGFAPDGDLRQGTALRPSVNAARVATAYGMVDHLYAQSDAWTGVHSSVAVGKLGVVIDRPAPPPPGNDTTYQQSLNSMFNLLVPTATAFAMPGQAPVAVTKSPADGIGPQKGTGASDDYVYSRLFDVRALMGKDWPVGTVAGYGRAMLDSSPYAFNGGTLGVAFQWLDPYGDLLASNLSASIPIGYTDALAGLQDWPGLAVSYTLGTVNNARLLTLKRAWTSPVSATAPDAAAQTYNIVSKLATIYHQLGAAAVSLNLSLLIDPVLAPPRGGVSLADLLRRDIAAIVDALDPPGGGGGSAVVALTDIVFELPMDDAKYRTDILIPLAVSAVFVRSGAVADGFQSEPTITQATTILSPDLLPAQASATSAQRSYANFATNFEPAFASLDMKVMAGNTDAPSGAQLWIMRYGASGLSLAVDQGVTVYAPPPFSTVLLSRSKITNSFTFKSFSIPAQTANAVDLDALMVDFLTAYETVLSPPYLATAQANSDPSVAGLLATKQKLAQTLAGRLVGVLDGAAPPQAAVDTFTQSCLVSLGNYYDTDAVAVLPVTTTLATGTNLGPKTLNLYGAPIQGKNTNIQVSSAKTALGTQAGGLLAMTVKTHVKGEEASYTLPDTFRMTAFEIVDSMLPVPTPDGAGASLAVGTWVRFVRDSDNRLTIGGTVQLPLRAYPRSPVITRQDFSQEKGQAAGAGVLGPAQDWYLDVEYRHTYAAQDTIVVTADLNLTPELSMPMALRQGAVPDDLLDTLVQFAAYYPQVQPLLESGLRDGGYTEQTGEALAAFHTLAAAIEASVTVQLRSVSPPVRAGRAALTAAADSHRFLVTEGFDSSQSPDLADWQVTVTPVPNPQTGAWSCPIPLMSALDYRGQLKAPPQDAQTYTLVSGGATLKAAPAMAATTRALSVGPLSIIDQHNGRYSLSIIRNLGLAPAFQYATPTLTPSGVVLPFIDRSVDQNIALLPPVDGGSGDAATLNDALTRLYVDLMTGMDAAPTNPPVGIVQTVASLSYPVSGGSFALPRRVLPMVLDLHQSIPFYPRPADVASTVAGLVAAINDWRKAEGVPDALVQTAQLEFEVSVFSPWSTTGMPIIHVTGLYVPGGAVAWK